MYGCGLNRFFQWAEITRLYIYNPIDHRMLSNPPWFSARSAMEIVTTAKNAFQGLGCWKLVFSANFVKLPPPLGVPVGDPLA